MTRADLLAMTLCALAGGYFSYLMLVTP